MVLVFCGCGTNTNIYVVIWTYWLTKRLSGGNLKLYDRVESFYSKCLGGIFLSIPIYPYDSSYIIQVSL